MAGSANNAVYNELKIRVLLFHVMSGHLGLWGQREQRKLMFAQKTESKTFKKKQFGFINLAVSSSEANIPSKGPQGGCPILDEVGLWWLELSSNEHHHTSLGRSALRDAYTPISSGCPGGHGIAKGFQDGIRLQHACLQAVQGPIAVQITAWHREQGSRGST